MKEVQLSLFPEEPKPLGGGFLLWMDLLKPAGLEGEAYPFSLPAIASLERLEFHRAVTFLVGENGSGKSTLLEGLAVRLGFNAEGGGRNFNFATRETHSPLHHALRVARRAGRESDNYFLRAESFYNLASQIDDLGVTGYGDVPVHERSHGEAFLTILTQRLRGNGLYLFDEPEAALSPQRQMAVLSHLHALVKHGSQLIIATHSPILLSYPHATIYECSASGLRQVGYEETEAFRVTRDFLVRWQRLVPLLLEDAEEE